MTAGARSAPGPALALTATVALAVTAAAALALTCFAVVCLPGAAAAATPGLRAGDRGPDVTWLQLRLADLGFLKAQPTGYFGPNTGAAVRGYQRALGIAVSGVAGPKTCGALLNDPWKVAVARGDTLGGIAASHQVTVKAVLAANPQVVNPNRIIAGQSLIIPGTPGILKIAGVPSPEAVPASGTGLVPATTPETGAGANPAPAPTTGSPPPPVLAGSTVLLTFNGGPDPEVIPRILEVLRREGCRATFFFCGKEMARHADLVRSVCAQGHSVQSCGWQGTSLLDITETSMSSELDATARLIAELTGQPPAWYRPPGGMLSDAIVCSARRTGHGIVMWQNIGALPEGPSTVGRMDRYMGDSTVIRLPGTDPTTMTYLEALLDHWKSCGVTFLAPSELGRSPAAW